MLYRDGGSQSLLPASHALCSALLPASQPGSTILDPLAASLLGMFLFGEHMRAGTLDLSAEAAGLARVVAGSRPSATATWFKVRRATASTPFRGGRGARGWIVAGLHAGQQPKG